MRGAVIVLVLLLSGVVHGDDEMPNAVPTVMDRRWAFSLAYGPNVVSSELGDNIPPMLLGFDVSGRFRARADLDLAASFTGGTTREVGWAAVFADLRYHLFAESPWHPYILGGAGAGTVYGLYLGSGARLAGRVGVGLERRLVSWGFSAELEGIAIDGGKIDPDKAPMGEFGTVLASTLFVNAVYYWGSPRRRPCEKEWRAGACVRD